MSEWVRRAIGVGTIRAGEPPAWRPCRPLVPEASSASPRRTEPKRGGSRLRTRGLKFVVGPSALLAGMPLLESHGRARTDFAARARRAVLGTVAVAVLIGVGAGAASASSLCTDCTASYSGTWTVNVTGGTVVTLNFAESLQSGNWSLTSASGSYHVPANPGNHDPGCDATLSLNASAAAMLGSFGPNVTILRSGYWTAELFPPTYWGSSNDPVTSSASTGDCASSARVDYAGLSHGLSGPQCHFDPSTSTNAIDFPVGASYTVQDSCSGTVTTAGVDYTATLQSTVTFTSPGSGSPGTSPSGPPPFTGPIAYGPFFDPAKIDARDDMRMHAIPTAIQYCIPFATGTLLTGAGVLLTAVPGGAGVTLTVAGELTASAAAPFCGATITRLVNDYRAYHDPPRNDFAIIARPALAHTAALPPCPRSAGAASGLCQSLRAAERRWVIAAKNSESVAAAIKATVSREHAAYIAGQQSAVNAQDAALKTLLTDRRRTNGAEAAAGRAVARALRAANLRLRLTRPQSALVIALVKRRIAADGVPAVDVIGIDPAAFKPRPHDLLAGLGSL